MRRYAVAFDWRRGDVRAPHAWDLLPGTVASRQASLSCDVDIDSHFVGLAVTVLVLILPLSCGSLAS